MTTADAPTTPPADPVVLFSADPDYLAAATFELRAAFPGATVTPFGPDAARLSGAGDAAEVAARCRAWPVAFARHLMAERRLLAPGEARRDKRVVARAVVEVLEALGEVPPVPRYADDPRRPVALQAWVSGESPLAYGTEELWHHVAEELGRRGWAAGRSGADLTIGLCAGPAGVSIGVTPSLPGYADWPGGRIRLRRDPAQVSRAEFKLEELLALGLVEFPGGGLAVDLGAAPGGWTRVLRSRGLRVVAVDPAALDPRLDGDDGIRHVQATAAPFLARTDETFDVVVNDMRMVPALSVELMLAASARVRPGGLGVMSLKLTPHRAVETVDRALGALRQRWEIDLARQLQHNRNEATVVLRRPS